VDTEQLIRDVVRNVIGKLKNEMPSGSSISDQSKPVCSGKVKTYESKGLSSEKTIRGTSTRKIVCGISVRHIHLCREHLDVLFGKGYEPQILKELYQPGTYAYKETVTIVGPKLSAIQNVRILGPLRDKSQVELAKTDCIILGIDAPVRRSGDLAGSSSAVIIGPKGAVYLSEGVIRANRHIHLSEEDAAYFGISNNQEVDVRTGGPKGLTFNNVQVRVSPDFKSEMHVDTDDGNAGDIVNGTLVEIVDASCVSSIIPQMANSNNIPPQIPDGSFAGEIADPNVLKSMNTFLDGKSGEVSVSPVSSQSKESPSAGITKAERKVVITVEDLEQYRQSGIKLTKNIILSPLARDEAKKRGIKIS